MMMLALMYGMIFSAKTVMRRSAPPVAESKVAAAPNKGEFSPTSTATAAIRAPTGNRGRGFRRAGKTLEGGFGSAVWETLNETGGAQTRILRVGVPDRYVTHGAPALLHEEIGYTPERIAERVRAAIDRPTFAER